MTNHYSKQPSGRLEREDCYVLDKNYKDVRKAFQCVCTSATTLHSKKRFQ